MRFVPGGRNMREGKHKGSIISIVARISRRKSLQDSVIVGLRNVKSFSIGDLAYVELYLASSLVDESDHINNRSIWTGGWLLD